MSKVKASCWSKCNDGAKRQSLGWSASRGSRWGVVRLFGSVNQPWVLRHLRSGQSIVSLLPAVRGKIALDQLVKVCAALDACGLDFGPFDALPLVGPDYDGPAPFFAPGAVPEGFVDQMQTVAREALK